MIAHPKAICVSVVLSVLFMLVLFLLRPYCPAVPVNPEPYGSVDWWAWYLFN